MRVLHVIPSLSPSSGGPGIALPAMARALANEGIKVDVACTDDDGPGRRTGVKGGGAPVDRDGFRLFQFPKQTEFYKASLPLMSWLNQHMSEYDVAHIHAVFSFSTIAAARAARAARVPYIIRPLGILNTWGMENRRRRIKALSFRLLDKPLLDHAAAMHYTSTQERIEAEKLGLRAPGHVIPLGIDLSPFDSLPAAAVFTDAFPETKDRDMLLFLSRIDKKKGIDLLLDAFALIASASPRAHLVIAGDGPADLTSALKLQARGLGIDDRITWAGHLDGSMKLAAFSAARLFILPSSSENFGIALLEAMAAGVASLSCKEVALAAEAAPDEAVMLADRTAESFSSRALHLLRDDGARRHLAETGHRIARRDYSLHAMGAKLLQLYQNLVAA